MTAEDEGPHGSDKYRPGDTVSNKGADNMVELTLFYAEKHRGERQHATIHLETLELAQKHAEAHVGPHPFISGSGLSDLYATNLTTAQSLRAVGIHAEELFPRLKEIA